MQNSWHLHCCLPCKIFWRKCFKIHRKRMQHWGTLEKPYRVSCRAWCADLTALTSREHLQVFIIKFLSTSIYDPQCTCRTVEEANFFFFSSWTLIRTNDKLPQRSPCCQIKHVQQAHRCTLVSYFREKRMIWFQSFDFENQNSL